MLVHEETTCEIRTDWSTRLSIQDIGKLEVRIGALKGGISEFDSDERWIYAHLVDGRTARQQGDA